MKQETQAGSAGKFLPDYGLIYRFQPAGRAAGFPDGILPEYYSFPFGFRNPLIGSVVITHCMKVLIIIAPEKFRDEEYTVPAAALQKAGIGFDVASVNRGPCTGMLGTKVNATLSFEEVDPKSYDGILIVGGGGAQVHLWNDEILGGMVRYFQTSAKVVAAICLAPVVLARAGVLKGKKATYFNSPVTFREMKAGGAVLVDKAVVSDSRIVTANGPEAAAEFAEVFIRALTAVEW
jgi:protease I